MAITIRRLSALRLRDIVSFVRRQPISFWGLNFYVFIEYVRPQSIYPSLNFLPWGKVSIIVTTLALLLEGRQTKLQAPANPWLAAFTAIIMIGCVTAYIPGIAFEEVSLYLTWVLVYVLIVAIINTEEKFLVFMLGFLLHSSKMSQHGVRTWASIGFGFQDWGATGGPGWFQNSGEFGIQMDVFFPLSAYFCLALHEHWGLIKKSIFIFMPLSAVASMIASSSRGALLGGAGAALWMVSKSKYRVRAFLGMGIFAFIAITAVPDKQVERFKSSGTDTTSTLRLRYWKDGIKITNEFPLTGLGFANWIPYYQRYYNPRGQVQHNIFVQAGSEAGYPGLLVFIALIVVTWVTNAQTRQVVRRAKVAGRFIPLMAHALDAALVGYLISGFFVTVLFYPYFWFNLAMTSALFRVAQHAARKGTVVPQADEPAEASSSGGLLAPKGAVLRPAALRALPTLDRA